MNKLRIIILMIVFMSGCNFQSNTEFEKSYLAQSESLDAFVHISYDDCIVFLKDINQNADIYDSIFDNPFLAKLQYLNEKYGAVFTLNIFRYDSTGFDLANMTTAFKDEFSQNSDWLKFAVHWVKTGIHPETLSNEVVVKEYNDFTDIIINFSSRDNIDTIIRPSYFSFNKSAQIELKKSNALFDGCLTADDDRESNCGLTDYWRNILNNYDYGVDYINNLYYFRSTVRMDNLSPEKMKKILNKELNDSKNNKMFIVFAHEKENFTDFEPVCQWAKDNGIRFDFPVNQKNKIGNILN